MMNVSRDQYNILSLEEEFAEQHIREVNVNEDCNFTDFLAPNENSPEDVIEHLEKTEGGILVSTGTERSFFNICAIQDKFKGFKGLVIRDINPKVKAYVDFNTALIRISNTREEYNNWTLEDLEKITNKLKNNSMSQKIKSYYIENAMIFGEIYFAVDKSWRSQDSFKAVNYTLNDDQFQSIKQSAEAGNIISTIGEINDLMFLKNRSISVVDTSNICDYTVIDLQGGCQFKPRVIWTDVFSKSRTYYYSYMHVPMTSDRRDTFQILIKKIGTATKKFPHDGDTFSHWMTVHLPEFRESPKNDIFNNDFGFICSLSTLNALENMAAKNLLEIDGISPLYMTPKECITKINHLHGWYLDAFSESKETIKFLPLLVQYSPNLHPEISLAFSKMEVWRQACEEHFIEIKYCWDFHQLLLSFKDAGVLDQFTQNFGEERLANLKEQVKKVIDQRQQERMLAGKHS